MERQNRYSQLIEKVFLDRYQPGSFAVPFSREDLSQAASELGVTLPKNLGDIIYSFRYRTALPDAILERAPEGQFWIIQPAGRGKYSFVATTTATIEPNPLIGEIKVPDATPGIISAYALSDEQSLLAKVRYNRLVDIFTGNTCYSLQNHLRTSVGGLGQVETDEVYIGIDQRGAQYVFPIQAKGGKDVLSIVQIGQDVAMCAEKFPSLLCRPVAAQFVGADLIALFLFDSSTGHPSLLAERHYRLTQPEEIASEELDAYRHHPFDPRNTSRP
ncbi:MAG: endonuclease [Thermomicrobiales bacterium]